jgi:ribonucleoside-diphosphate reductase subunit M1
MTMMNVKKRSGKYETISFDKITNRISKLINEDEKTKLNAILISQKTISSIYDGITTEELDIESANICINLSTQEPLYSKLGSRILISNLHKNTNYYYSDNNHTFSKLVKYLSDNLTLINKEWVKWITDNSDYIDSIINYKRDYFFDYFGYKTLERSYLLKIKNKIVERPQDMYMRIATTINFGNLEKIKNTYDYLSNGYFTFGSPTLFNSGTNNLQLSSCFLLGMDDNLNSITDTWKSCAEISKWSGGIGLHVSSIRANASIIKSTNGLSNGIIPLLRVFNNIARYVNQGGKRLGSIAIYLETHHADILQFLELKKNFGNEEERARDLFLSLWISDLFMKQVKNDGDWYLMCPSECPDLNNVYGDEYEKLYWSYVNQNKYKEKISAKKLLNLIMTSQIETGTPYIGYKDHINRKCNQNNLGTIKSSNLCHEITEYSDSNEYAVCNLASIAINKCLLPFDNNGVFNIYTKLDCKLCDLVKTYMKNNNFKYNEFHDIPDEFKNKNFTYPLIYHSNKFIGGWNEFYKYTSCTYDYDKLYDIAYNTTLDLNKIIDINYYPVIQARRSNMKHRPVGIGIQGLADTLVSMRIQFDSNESLDLNSHIMETIYLAALTASNDVAKERYEDIKYFVNNKLEIPEFYDKNFRLENEKLNYIYHKYKLNTCENKETKYYGAYSTFEGSQFSKGILQFDNWMNESNYNKHYEHKLYYKEKWDLLKDNIKKYGTRNSLLTALMPTATTSQILGNNECFEFFTNNIYTRKTLAGEFPLINRYLVNDLISLNLWNEDIKNLIIYNNGSIQNINKIPNNIKNLYKTIWEIPQKWVMLNALFRSYFVDQTQSMNLYMDSPDYQRLASSQLWAWENGLKTGIYYLRTKPAESAIKFTIQPNLIENECENGVCEFKVKPKKEENECDNCHS